MDENPTNRPIPLDYAARDSHRWTRLEKACVSIFITECILLVVPTIAALYEEPGRRMLPVPYCGINFLLVGGAGTLLCPVLFVVALGTRNRMLVVGSLGIVALTVVWVWRVFYLLSFL